MKKKQVKQAAKKAGKLVKVGHVDDIPDAHTRADVKRRMVEEKAAKKAAAALGLGEQEWILESLLDSAKVALHAGLGVVLTAEVARDLAAYTGAKSWEELAMDLDGQHRTMRGGQLVLVFREVPGCLR